MQVLGIRSRVLHDAHALSVDHGLDRNEGNDDSMTTIVCGDRKASARYWVRGFEGTAFIDDYKYLSGVLGDKSVFCMISNTSFGYWWHGLKSFIASNPQIPQWHRTFPCDEVLQRDGTYTVGTLRVTVSRGKKTLSFESSSFAPRLEPCISYEEIKDHGLEMLPRDAHSAPGNFVHSSMHPVWVRINCQNPE